MIVDILILLAGLALLIFGAEWLVDGSSSIARRAGLSEFLIGMTIVGIGTSLPELVVSLTGALMGSADIAIGNVVGSNIFNVFLILGVTALIRPVAISDGNKRRDIPLNIAACLLLIVGIGLMLLPEVEQQRKPMLAKNITQPKVVEEPVAKVETAYNNKVSIPLICLLMSACSRSYSKSFTERTPFTINCAPTLLANSTANP